MRKKRILWALAAVVLILSLLSFSTTVFAADSEEPTTTEQSATDVEESVESEEESEEEIPDTPFYSTIWSLLPPVVAIALALITKEVYSSLFVGILVGACLYANMSFEGTINQMFISGFVGALSDAWNVGILLFLVLLGAIVALMNKAGGSAAFGQWASKHIKTRVGAQLATVFLGILIFIDDYFNCLTVGSVMRPATDKFQVSRAKLSYLIDATAAPICIIAPISSWAAAVAGFAQGSGTNGIGLFIKAIPYNMYAILTIVMMIILITAKFDFGPMAKFEANAMNGDLFTTEKPAEAQEAGDVPSTKAKVWDLVLPIVFLIGACVLGMIYSGEFFLPGSEQYHDFVGAFANCDASVGLVFGSFAGLIFTVVYMLLRRLLNFQKAMECIPEGFKAMVPAIMILTCAWTLKVMTDSLGADVYIAGLVKSSAAGFMNFLPAIIFLIAVGLSFATGTSWGTFGILIPIVIAAFGGFGSELTVIAISACMAGAVCGDHCSPISDTTIMASAGGQCRHIDHVSTQLPYALVVAAVSFVAYLVAGFVQNAVVTILVGVVLLFAVLLLIRMVVKKKNAGNQ